MNRMSICYVHVAYVVYICILPNAMNCLYVILLSRCRLSVLETEKSHNNQTLVNIQARTPDSQVHTDYQTFLNQTLVYQTVVCQTLVNIPTRTTDSQVRQQQATRPLYTRYKIPVNIQVWTPDLQVNTDFQTLPCLQEYKTLVNIQARTRLTGAYRPPDLFKPIPDRCMPNPCQHTYQDNRLTGTSTTGNQTLVHEIQDPCQHSGLDTRLTGKYRLPDPALFTRVQDPCQHPSQDTRLTGTHRLPYIFKPVPCIPDLCIHQTHRYVNRLPF